MWLGFVLVGTELPCSANGVCVVSPVVSLTLKRDSRRSFQFGIRKTYRAEKLTALDLTKPVCKLTTANRFFDFRFELSTFAVDSYIR